MKIWVVELRESRVGAWRPTVGVALCRAEGRIRLAEWRRHNPDDYLRLVPYRRVGRKTP